MHLDELAMAVVNAEQDLNIAKSNLQEAHDRKRATIDALLDAIHTKNLPDQIAIDLGDDIMYCDWDGEFLDTALIPKH